MKKRAIMVTVLVILVSFGTMACNQAGNGVVKGGQTYEVESGELAVTVNGSGNIEIAKTRERGLSFGVGGRIDEIKVEKGDRVNKGEEMARLDTSALELGVLKAEDALETAKRVLEDTKEPYDEVDIAVAKSTLAATEAQLSGAYNAWALDQQSTAKWAAVKAAEADLERAQETWDKIEEGFDAEDVAEAERKVAIAEASLEDVRRQLRDAVISAPFGGVIASVDAYEGDIVTPAVMIIKLIDPESKELKIEVDEIDIPQVKVGQRAVIEVEAYPEVEIEGKVSYIYPLSIETFGVVVYEVTIEIEEREEYELLDGMSASADIVVEELQDVLLVPSRAIKRDSEGNRVVEVIEGKEIEERVVSVGASDGDRTEVKEGLEEGQMVLLVERG